MGSEVEVDEDGKNDDIYAESNKTDGILLQEERYVRTMMHQRFYGFFRHTCTCAAFEQASNITCLHDGV
jgi:hypothetical protein